MATFKCPCCGAPLSVWGVNAGGPQSQYRELGDRLAPWKRDAMPAALPMPAPMFKPPVTPPRWDTATVAQASLTTGAMLGMFAEGVVVVCVGVGVEVALTTFILAPTVTLLFIAPIAWCILSFTPWTILSIIEKGIGIDINGDGYTGEPPEIPVIKWETSTYDKKGHLTGMKNLEFHDIEESVLVEFLTALVNGLPLTGPSWKGESGSLSQAKFTAVMRELERAGYVRNYRGNVGRKLTPQGAITLRYQIEPSPEPLKRP